MKPLPILLVLALALTACANNPPRQEAFKLEQNTKFDGETLRFFVRLDSGAVATVNTNDDVIEILPGATPMPGHRAQAYTFLKVKKEGTSLSHALLSWDPDNPADYLVFGWWAEFVGQHPPGLSLADAERWALVDGPELDHGIVPEVPVEGTATYLGQAGGLYRFVPGGEPGEDFENVVLEEYQGTITLTADFFDGTVKGCIGCTGDIVTRRAHFGVILGEEVDAPEGTAKDFELHLTSAIIREDGHFVRYKVNLRHPERTITKSDGYWAGAFSSRQDTDGNPRLAAGFSYVDFEQSDGTEGEFYGSFLGLSKRFRENGVSSPLPEGNGRPAKK
ncbi:MAG: hypothetical protein OXG98_15760 [Gemmatimonadetes bacterium]|nr:hypothetical protein [Gemmatimonadota bacterium]